MCAKIIVYRYKRHTLPFAFGGTMKNPLILTFDCGTQSIRCTLVDKQGNIVAMATEKTKECFALKRGWAEQDAEQYAQSFCNVAQKLKKDSGDLWNDIIAVTTTAIRDTNVCMDKNGKAIRPIIMWLDQREAEFNYKQVPLFNRLLLRLVGMTETAKKQGKVTAANWIRENEPENWKNTYKYMTISGYINHMMTGKFIESKACQAAHIPYHYRKRQWKSKRDIQWKIFNVDQDKLYDLVEPGEILGYITEDFAQKSGITQGLPVVATGGDKCCEALGCGVTKENMACISFGTQSTIQFATKKYVEPETFMPSYTAVIPGQYNPEIQIYRGYWMVTWFIEQFAQKEVEQAKEQGISVEELLDKHLNEVVPGCDGLVLQPMWAPPLKSPEARGTILGFNHVHTKWHLYRAIIEGINFGLYDAYKKIQKRIKTKIDRIIVAGGGSRSDIVCQMTANMFGLPVTRVQTWEASSLGSSMAGFVSIGEHKDFDTAIDNMVSYKDTFNPQMDEHTFYDKLYNDVYKKLYKKLKKSYIRLKSHVWDEK